MFHAFWLPLTPLGCLIGRLAARPLNRCPFAFSGGVAAFLPIAVGLTGLLGAGIELPIQGLLVGAGGLVGTFLSGHGGKLRACLFAFAGGLVGIAVGAAI